VLGSDTTRSYCCWRCCWSKISVDGHQSMLSRNSWPADSMAESGNSDEKVEVMDKALGCPLMLTNSANQEFPALTMTSP